MKWTTLLSVVLPVLLSFLGVFYSSLPSYSGTVYLNGLRSKAEITRDKLGVPFISAETRQDAMFALGFAHAQDRLWAMDIMRRTALGRLSELLGAESFELDTFARNLRLNHLSEKAASSVSQQVAADLASYSDGINACVRKMTMLPPEYLLTWSSFESWQPQHSLAILQLMGVKWGYEFLRYHLSKIVGADVAALLLPLDSALADSIVRDGAGSEPVRVGEKLANADLPGSQTFEDHMQPGGFFSSGSNAWVVSGHHTESGKPLLANDIQVVAGIPTLWYLATLKYGLLTISGGTVPGVPAVLTGQNENMAWTLSYLNADTIDLYLEKANPANPLQYLDGSTYLNFSYREEEIKVKGEARPRIAKFEETKRGPVLKRFKSGPKLFDTKFLTDGVDATISLRWSLFEVYNDSSLEGFMKLMEAKSIDDVRSSLALVTCGAFAVLYGLTDNTIGFQAAGRIPNISRRNKYSHIPLEGWKRENDWDGFLEFWNLPHVENPSNGYIIAANNVPTLYGVDVSSIGCEFTRFRAARIQHLLDIKIKHGAKLTTKDMLEIQNDDFSPVAEAVLPHVLTFANHAAQASRTYEELKTWNYQMQKDITAPTFFQALLTKVMTRLVEDEVSNKEVLSNLLNAPAFMDFVVGLFRQDAQADNTLRRWCDDIRTEKRETCEDVISAAFLEVEKQGAGKWGNAHEIQLSHNPFSRSKWRFFFHKVVPLGGASDSVHAVGFHRNAGFGAVSGPSLRLVMDLGHKESGFWGLETGQSGNIFSAHYGDMSDAFHSGTLPQWIYSHQIGKTMTLEVANRVN